MDNPELEKARDEVVNASICWEEARRETERLREQAEERYQAGEPHPTVTSTEAKTVGRMSRNSIVRLSNAVQNYRAIRRGEKPPIDPPPSIVGVEGDGS